MCLPKCKCRRHGEKETHDRKVRNSRGTAERKLAVSSGQANDGVDT